MSCNIRFQCTNYTFSVFLNLIILFTNGKLRLTYHSKIVNVLFDCFYITFCHSFKDGRLSSLAQQEYLTYIKEVAYNPTY